MTREALREKRARELDYLSSEQLKTVRQLISTFTEPTTNQEALRDV